VRASIIEPAEDKESVITYHADLFDLVDGFHLEGCRGVAYSQEDLRYNVRGNCCDIRRKWEVCTWLSTQLWMVLADLSRNWQRE
jgi:hypothetical protein